MYKNGKGEEPETVYTYTVKLKSWYVFDGTSDLSRTSTIQRRCSICYGMDGLRSFPAHMLQHMQPSLTSLLTSIPSFLSI